MPQTIRTRQRSRFLVQLVRGGFAVLAAVLVTASATARPAHRAAAQGADAAFVDRVLASLSPDERVGQLVMVNFVGDDVSAQSDIASLLRDFKVGAVILQASNGNIVNRGDTGGQLAALTNGLQQRAFEATARPDLSGGEYFLPLLVAVDNEGDGFPFANVTHNYTAVPNNMTIGATWNKNHAEAVGRTIGEELGAAGINMLLGPVVDVLDNPRSGGNGDIGIRSFGGNPTWVGELGRAYVRGVHEGSAGRMLTVAKHFPGHGGSDRGTDNEVPTVNKSLDQLRTSELAPFAELDRTDAADPEGVTDAMMVSHIRFRSFLAGGATPFTGPISIDASAFGALMALPEFSAWRANHLVMADALGVPAVKQWYAAQGQPDFPNRSIVKDALLAGNDLLPLVEFYRDQDSSGWKDYQLPVIQDSILYMREQYASDPDFRRRADDAVRHVIASKVALYPKLRLADVTVDAAKAASVAGSNKDDMRTLAEDALTLLQPQSVEELRARVPRGPVTPDKVLIVECWEDCYPYRIMPKLELQNSLLALYGPTASGRLQPGDVTTISFAELDSWLSAPADPATAGVRKAVTDASWIVLALSEYNPIARPVSGAAKRLLDSPPVDLRNKNVVAIAYNVPYHLDSTEISKLSAYFAVYSKTDDAIAAAWRALFGDVTPKGHSPVNVSGIFYNVADAVQPDEAQRVAVAVYGQDAGDVNDGRNLALVAGPIADRNGNPVPDGTAVSFTLTKEGGTAISGTGTTIDGMASATLALSGRGSYTATASVRGIAPAALAVRVGGDVSSPEPTAPNDVAAQASGGGSSWPLLALVIGAPVAAFGLVSAGAAFVLARRRRRGAAPGVAAAADGTSAGTIALSLPAEAARVVAVEAPPRLRVDVETRRVYVNGAEARPPLSNEQFKLLAYLHERAGKVVSREDLVRNVWPDAHAEGVSEEALDALVRRVRERIVQAGGERSYIATLRGHGFRLDA